MDGVAEADFYDWHGFKLERADMKVISSEHSLCLDGQSCGKLTITSARMMEFGLDYRLAARINACLSKSHEAIAANDLPYRDMNFGVEKVEWNRGDNSFTLFNAREEKVGKVEVDALHVDSVAKVIGYATKASSYVCELADIGLVYPLEKIFTIRPVGFLSLGGPGHRPRRFDIYG